LGHLAILEDQFAGRRSPDAQLVFLLADGKPREILLDQKRRNSLVASRRVHGSEEYEKPSLLAVRDPEFASVQNIVAALECGPGLQGKCIRTRTGFAERVSPAGVRRHPWKVTL